MVESPGKAGAAAADPAEKLEEPEVDAVAADSKGPKVEQSNAVLNAADSGLFSVIGHANVLTPMSTAEGLGLLYHGARSKLGIKSGRYYFETRCIFVGGEQDPLRRGLRVGVSTNKNVNDLYLEDDESAGFDVTSGVCYSGKDKHATVKIHLAHKLKSADVVGVLVQRSSSPGSLSLYLNGQRVTDPLPLPDAVKDKAVYPVLMTKGAPVQANFGPSIWRALSYKVRMLADAAKQDVEVSKRVNGSNGEAIVAVGFDTSALLKKLSLKMPDHQLLSPDALQNWATKSGVVLPGSGHYGLPVLDTPSKIVPNFVTGGRKVIFGLSQYLSQKRRSEILTEMVDVPVKAIIDVATIEKSAKFEEGSAAEEVSMPSKDEGFTNVEYFDGSQAEAQSKMSEWRRAAKLKIPVRKIQKSPFFDDYMKAFREVVRKMKGEAAAGGEKGGSKGGGKGTSAEKKTEEKDGKDGGEKLLPEDSSEEASGSKEDEFPVLDFGEQAAEYWVLVNLYGELHAVLHAFAKDVAAGDPERPGFPLESLGHYFREYVGKDLRHEHFRCKDHADLLEKYVDPDVASVDKESTLLKSQLPADFEPKQIVLLVHQRKATFQDRFEAGDESAKLHFKDYKSGKGKGKGKDKWGGGGHHGPHHGPHHGGPAHHGSQHGAHDHRGSGHQASHQQHGGGHTHHHGGGGGHHGHGGGSSQQWGGGGHQQHHGAGGQHHGGGHQQLFSGGGGAGPAESGKKGGGGGKHGGKQEQHGGHVGGHSGGHGGGHSGGQHGHNGGGNRSWGGGGGGNNQQWGGGGGGNSQQWGGGGGAQKRPAGGGGYDDYAAKRQYHGGSSGQQNAPAQKDYTQGYGKGKKGGGGGGY